MHTEKDPFENIENQCQLCFDIIDTTTEAYTYYYGKLVHCKCQMKLERKMEEQ